MEPIEILILHGHGKGQRDSHTASPITFGRSTDCTLVIQEDVISREHASLVYDHGWHLVNASANGTELNRKTIKKKPRQLRDGDVISVGGIDLFQIHFATATAGADATDEQQPVEGINTASLSRKAKLWIGIGCYVALMLVLMVFLMARGTDTNKQMDFGGFLTAEQISEEIRKPFDKEIKSPRDAELELEKADRYRASADIDPGDLYLAHRAYKRALDYLDESAFDDPQTQLNFDQVERRLVERIQSDYARGKVHLEGKEFSSAQKYFARIQSVYGDTTSRIYQDAERKENLALKNR